MYLRRNKDILEPEVAPIEKILTHCKQNWLDHVGKTWDTQFTSWVQLYWKMETGTTFKEATRRVLPWSQNWVCWHNLVWISAWLFKLFYISLPPGECQDGTSIRARLLPSKPFPVHYSPDTLSWWGALGILVSWGTMLQAGRLWVQFPMRPLDFTIDLMLSATLWPWGQLSL
jgi:hypothetical protein